MSDKRIARICCAVGILVGIQIIGSAETLKVGHQNACPDAKYSTIGAAVAAAHPGAVIDICPGLYPEQLIITKPLTLRGISAEVNGLAVDRVLLQPALQDLQNLATEAVITAMNTHDVNIENLAIDASRNSVNGCSPSVAGVHYYNASGTVDHNAIFGARLANPQSCDALPFGNGFGVQIDDSQSGHFSVSVTNNSIHDYTANGVQATGTGINAAIEGNTI